MKPFFENHPDQIYIGEICDHPFPLHMHKAVEVVYLSRGQMTMTLGSRHLTVQPGEMVVSFPLVIHSYDAVSEDASGLAMIFNPDNIPEYAHVFREMIPNSFQISIARTGDLLPVIIDRLITLDPQTGESVKSGYLHLFLAAVIPSLDIMPANHSREADTVTRLITHISEHYLEPITLQSVSQAVCISPSYLSHIFSDQLCIHFRQYVNILRIDHARYLMHTDAHATLNDISFACGYEDIRTFRRAFTQVVGMSPHRYRIMKTEIARDED